MLSSTLAGQPHQPRTSCWIIQVLAYSLELCWKFLTPLNTPFASGLLRKRFGFCSINLDSDHPHTWRTELCTLSTRAVQCLLEQCYRHCEIHGAFTHYQELQLQTSAGLISIPIVNSVCDHMQTWDSLYSHTKVFSFSLRIGNNVWSGPKFKVF